MLRTRLWMGALLIGLALAVLAADGWFAPWYPCLFLLALLAAFLASRELVALLWAHVPRPWLCHAGVAALVLANWPTHVGCGGSVWAWIIGTFTGLVLVAFVVEAYHFREPGGAIVRLSLTLFVVAYLGLLASFLVQLRWLPGAVGSFGFALGVFVPKACDIGAYTAGRLFGKRRFAPILSPKKSWEGAIGGMVFATGMAWGINALSAAYVGSPLMPHAVAMGFGLVVGLVGMVGDLMESFIKRDCERKDASDVVPGFGGVLDVLDSIIFAAPVAYLFLAAFSS